MNGTEILKRALTELVIRDCFWASLALHIPFREDNTTQAAWTDGRVIAYNPRYIVSLYRENAEYVVSLVAHEVAHLMMMHHLRKPPAANHEKWNQACDYAIHCFLRDGGFELHPDWLYSHWFKNLSAEAIYLRLPDPSEPLVIEDDFKSRKAPNQGTVPGEVRDGHPNKEDGDGKSHPPKNNRGIAWAGAKLKFPHSSGTPFREIVARAHLDSRRHGWEPGELEEHLGRLPEPSFDWQRYLEAFLGDSLASGSTWRQPNERYIHRGLYLSSPGSELSSPVVVVIDSSASVTSEDMYMLAAEVQGITRVNDSETLVVWADAEVQGCQRLTSIEEINLVRRGGGGTDYRPAFDWVEREFISPSALIYLTDGMCDSFPELIPPYPVLWTIGGTSPNQTFPAPWGEVVMLK